MKKGNVGRRSIEVKKQHSVKALKAHFRKSTCAVERRKTQVIWWLVEGKSRQEVMALSAYSHVSLVDIIKRYNAEGLEGLKDRRHDNPGAPTLLSDEELLLLAQTVRKDYDKGKVWNGAKVVSWLRDKFGKEVYEQRAYEYLASISMSQQIPRPRHLNANALEQDSFKKKT